MWSFERICDTMRAKVPKLADRFSGWVNARKDAIFKRAADAFHEGGVLVGVLGLLEGLLQHKDPPTVWWFVGCSAVWLTMFCVGVYLDSKAKEERR